MGVLGWALLHGDLWTASGKSLEKAVYLSGTVVLSLSVYLVISYFLKGEEMIYVYGKIRERARGKTA
jgi:hypothetical protein